MTFDELKNLTDDDFISNNQEAWDYISTLPPNEVKDVLIKWNLFNNDLTPTISNNILYHYWSLRFIIIFVNRYNMLNKYIRDNINEN